MHSILLCLALLAAAAPSAQTLDVEITESSMPIDPTFTGNLDADDPVRENGAHYEAHEITVARHEQVSIEMASDDFDSYLIVRGPGGSEWINDDYEGSRNATVELIAEDAGTFTIWASGFGSQDVGVYAVTVDRQGIVQMDVTEGRLDYKDAQTIKGEYVDTMEIELAAGRSYVVELLSLGFDGFLRVVSPSGQVWRNDDAGTTTLSRIGPVEGAAGTWTVNITTSRADEVGAYDLRVITKAE